MARENDEYFIFNHDKAFNEGAVNNLVWKSGGLLLTAGSSGGSFVSPLLDSGRQGNVWRRVLLDINCTEGSSFVCTLYSHDLHHEADKINSLLRNIHKKKFVAESDMTNCQIFEAENKTDFLPKGVSGRYLTLRIDLYGGKSGSPMLKSLCVYARQESFVDYLPEIYRHEEGFLPGFLSLFSVQYFETEKRIENISSCFDPLAAPVGLIPWLAEISGVPNIPLWNTESLRRLLSKGTYRRKGTLTGLYELIEIFTGSRPYIAESFRMKCGIKEVEALYENFRLFIFLPAACKIEKSMEESLHIVIESYLPAGLSYRLVNLRERTCLGAYSYIGVNAVLNEYDAAVIDMNSSIGNIALM